MLGSALSSARPQHCLPSTLHLLMMKSPGAAPQRVPRVPFQSSWRCQRTDASQGARCLFTTCPLRVSSEVPGGDSWYDHLCSRLPPICF